MTLSSISGACSPLAYTTTVGCWQSIRDGGRFAYGPNGRSGPRHSAARPSWVSERMQASFECRRVCASHVVHGPSSNHVESPSIRGVVAGGLSVLSPWALDGLGTGEKRTKRCHLTSSALPQTAGEPRKRLPRSPRFLDASVDRTRLSSGAPHDRAEPPAHAYYGMLGQLAGCARSTRMAALSVPAGRK